MNDLTYPIDHELAEKGYKRLGWVFTGLKHPDLKVCWDLGHRRGGTDNIIKEVSHSNRGTDVTIYCEECKYFYKIDQGD